VSQCSTLGIRPRVGFRHLHPAVRLVIIAPSVGIPSPDEVSVMGRLAAPAGNTSSLQRNYDVVDVSVFSSQQSSVFRSTIRCPDESSLVSVEFDRSDDP
jgi:hypothetical protein